MSSFVKDFLEGLRNSSPAERYSLVATLTEPEGPINALAFNLTGTALASGGDDETIRIWDLSSFKCVQVISDSGHQWGQITALKYAQMGPDVSSEWLCFGTGFGMIVVYRRARKSTHFVELLKRKVFTSGDPVESFAFDPHYRRLAIGSHYGNLKVFQMEGNIRDLTLLWEDRYDKTILRSLFFVDRGERLNIYTMENGDVICRDAETSEEAHAKRLQSPIGHADVNHSTMAVVIENMVNGFDLYPLNKSTPTRNLPIETARMFIKPAVFAENGKVIVTGSDHGKVYVFATTSSTAVQTLSHGGRDQLVQAVEASSTPNGYIIASGGSSGKSEVKIWTKSAVSKRSRGSNAVPPASEFQRFLNIGLIAFVAFLTADKWLPYMIKNYEAALTYFTTDVSRDVNEYFEKIQDRFLGLRSHPTATVEQSTRVEYTPTFSEIVLALDDETLRKVMGLGARLTEEEIREGQSGISRGTLRGEVSSTENEKSVQTIWKRMEG